MCDEKNINCESRVTEAHVKKVAKSLQKGNFGDEFLRAQDN